MEIPNYLVCLLFWLEIEVRFGLLIGRGISFRGVMGRVISLRLNWPGC